MLLNLVISLAPFILIAAGLVLCIYVFLSLKKEIHVLQTRLHDTKATIETALESIQAEIDDLKQGLREAEERTGVMVAPSPPPSGLNLNKRSQALRMYRRGEVSEKIAAALNLPRREVDLLIKVQKIVIGGSDTTTS